MCGKNNKYASIEEGAIDAETEIVVEFYEGAFGGEGGEVWETISYW